MRCGVIRRGDRILIAQRERDSRLEALKWEFPGGNRVHRGSRLCLEREIKEEMDFEIGSMIF